MSRWVSRHPLLAVGLPAVLSLVIGLGVGHYVVSPEQVAVDAAAPAPTTLTAPVTLGTLRQSLPVDASVGPLTSVKVVPAAPPEGAVPIVSAVHVKAGDTLQAGVSVVDVGGRPTFVLPGAVAAYRSLKPGGTGSDVTQLQAALRGLGYEISTDEVSYGSGTKAAVEKFYIDRGYTPMVEGMEDVASAADALEQAERAESAAETSVARAKRDRDAVNKSVSEKPKDAEQDPSNQQPPAGAGDAVKDTKLALDYARQDTEKAEAALLRARTSAGAQVPLGEMVFVAALPAIVSAVALPVGVEVGEGSVTLTSGALVARGELNQAQGNGVTAEIPATIITTDGQQFAATVTAVTQTPGKEGADATRTLTATPAEALPPKLGGQTVRLVVALNQSEEQSLLVPEAAVVTTADGTSTVRVTSDDGDKETTRDVPVTIGASGDGLVAVTPLTGASLSEGDSVVVGQLR